MIAIFIFFFQAEDGIRDLTVTGVQTCALPIFAWGIHERDRTSGNGNAAVCLLRKTDRRTLEPVSFLPRDGAPSPFVALFQCGGAPANPARAAIHAAGRGDLLLCCRICQTAAGSDYHSALGYQLSRAPALSKRPGPYPLRSHPEGQILIPAFLLVLHEVLNLGGFGPAAR